MKRRRREAIMESEGAERIASCKSYQSYFSCSFSAYSINPVVAHFPEIVLRILTDGVSHGLDGLPFWMPSGFCYFSSRWLW